MPAGGDHAGMDKHLLPNTAYAGLTRSQTDRFDIAELITAAATNDAGRLQFYRSISDKIEQQTGRALSTFASFYLPAEYLVRDLQAASGSAGGYLAGTAVPLFGPALKSASLIDALPLRRVAVADNAQLPVSTATPTTTWLANETSQAADAGLTFGARSATPKSISSVAWISRHLDLLQPATVRWVAADLFNALDDAAAVALVSGSGSSGQPLGLLTTSGVQSVTGTSLGWSGIRDALAHVEGYSSAAENIVFVMGVSAAKILRSREVATGSGLVLGADGRIGGYKVLISRAMPTDALLLTDWSRVSMLAWGAIELVVTPFSSASAFQRGAIGVRLIQSLDFVVDHPAAVVRSTSVT